MNKLLFEMINTNNTYEIISGFGRPKKSFPIEEVLGFYHRIIVEHGKYSHTWRHLRSQVEEEVARMSGGIEAAKITSSVLCLSQINRLNRNGPQNLGEKADGETTQEGREDLRDLIRDLKKTDFYFI
ncbi:hypothetical protein GW924_03285 [Candidatus Pacearchaeota archaeon]|nr:hypothetical protein [Candidatus Pacearchaeota archaeon]